MPVARKKAAKKKSARPSARGGHQPQVRTTTNQPVSEVFTTEERPAEQVHVTRGHVQLFVNGRNRGDTDTRGLSLKDFVVAEAQANGIRTFSVYVDNDKANTIYGSRPASSFAKVEIVTKDSRG